MDVLIDIGILASMVGIGYVIGRWSQRDAIFEKYLDELVEIKVVHS
jgi:hypothetical protein